MRKLLTAFTALLACHLCARATEAPVKIDFQAIASPVIFRGDATTAYRDPTAIYADGWMRLFFTLVKTEPDGKVYSYVAWSKSRDLIHWTPPCILTPRDQALNFGSPGDIVRFGKQWVLCLQTYPRPNGEKFGNDTARIWTMRSGDLEHWSTPELLRIKGPNVPREKMGRIIDPYLLQDKDDPGKWWCFSKGGGIAWSSNLETWTPAGPCPGGENPCVVVDGGQYVLFFSRNRPDGIGVMHSPDLKRWQEDGTLKLGQKDWPWAQGRLTAGFVLDLRRDPAVGKALMFFHGSDYPEYDKRGGFDNFASLGLAWSSDLKTWTWPGNKNGPTGVVPSTDFSKVPGVIVDYSPSLSGCYIGSPSLAVLPDGTYVASHDLFGPGSTEKKSGQTVLFHSLDAGKSWSKIAEVNGMFWGSLFFHRNALYLLGVHNGPGDVVIRKSLDGGKTWTTPENETNGVLFKGRYHGAPTPILEANGRIWRGMEICNQPFKWPAGFNATMLSVPAGVDLLQASNWKASNRVPGNQEWLDRRFRGWLEGNAIADRSGKIVDMMRVEYTPEKSKAALLDVSADGSALSFDPATGFIDFPGGNWKFTVRFDPVSQKYWSLANDFPPIYNGLKDVQKIIAKDPNFVRNTVVLVSSSDLKKWEIRSILLHDPNYRKHAFQYLDWLIEGNDIIALSRTAFEDGIGGARRPHDANFLTFHRFKNFRNLDMAHSVVAPEKLGLSR